MTSKEIIRQMKKNSQIAQARSLDEILGVGNMTSAADGTREQHMLALKKRELEDKRHSDRTDIQKMKHTVAWAVFVEFFCIIPLTVFAVPVVPNWVAVQLVTAAVLGAGYVVNRGTRLSDMQTDYGKECDKCEGCTFVKLELSVNRDYIEELKEELADYESAVEVYTTGSKEA